MRSRLHNWLWRLSDRLRYPGKSVQYELQRMTPKGGWRNFYTNPDHDTADSFPTPPPQPTFGPDTGYPPGRYRCLKRVAGRIETAVWTVTSPDVEEYYAELRASTSLPDPDTDPRSWSREQLHEAARRGSTVAALELAFRDVLGSDSDRTDTADDE